MLKIVLLEPFALRAGRFKEQSKWQSISKTVDEFRHIVKKLAEEYKTGYIKTQEISNQAAKAVSPEHWIWDGIHPLPQGHELIARIWLKEVTTRWPA